MFSQVTLPTYLPAVSTARTGISSYPFLHREGSNECSQSDACNVSAIGKYKKRQEQVQVAWLARGCPCRCKTAPGDDPCIWASISPGSRDVALRLVFV